MIPATMWLHDERDRSEVGTLSLRRWRLIDPDDPQGKAMSAETINVIAHAIAQLPQRQRDALMRSVIEGETLAAIAARHGISVPSAHRDLEQALAYVRALLQLIEADEAGGASRAPLPPLL